MGKDAKQAMKTDAEKKQELEQTTEIDRETLQVEPELEEHTVTPEDIREETGEISTPDNGVAPPPAEIPEGSVSIWDSDTELQQKYDIDIVYIPQQKKFAIKKYEFNPKNGEFDTKFDYIEERDLSKDAWNDEHLAHMMKVFSNDTKIEGSEVNLYDALKKDGPISYAYYNYEENVININYYNVPEGKQDECIAMLKKRYGYTDEQADNVLEILTSRDLLTRMSQYEHEAAHAEQNKKYGFKQYDIPPEYLAKIDMLSEVHANIVQAGYALDLYEVTGNLQSFDNLSIDPNVREELKKTIAENPDMEDRREYVAKFVYDKWLDSNNYDQSGYSNQAYNAASPRFHKYPLWALADNPEAQSKYHERIDAMFENVIGFGDIRKVINPDFELNDDLKNRLEWDSPMDNELLRAIMTKDAHNADQYIANLNAYFNGLRALDADGMRTPDELAQIDAHCQELINQQAERESGAPDMAATAVKIHRSERGR